MGIREEHEKHKTFWNERTAKRSEATPQFRYQYDFYRRYMEELEEPILDIGCGDGELLEFLIKDGRRDVYGVDISQIAIGLARVRLRRHLGDDAIKRLLVGDMICLSSFFKEGSFNTVFCEGTFHQTTYSGERMTAEEISKVVSENGLVYLSVRSDSTPPRNADKVEGEIETYRLWDEGGIVRCYFSEAGIVELFRDKFRILELEERELLTRIDRKSYKMRIIEMKKK